MALGSMTVTEFDPKLQRNIVEPLAVELNWRGNLPTGMRPTTA